MQRLLLVTDFFRPEPGGLESFFSCLAHQWQASQIEVIVTTHKRNYLSSEKQRQLYKAKQNFRIHRLQAGSMYSYVFQKKNPLRLFFAERLHSFRPHCVFFSTLSLLSYILSRQALDRGLPYAFLLHAGTLHHRLNSFYLFKRSFIRASNTVFTLSWYLARAGIKAGIPAEKICVLPPAFEPRWGNKNSSELPQWLKARIAKKTLLISVGPLVVRKGLEKAIEAVALLREQHSQIHYVIVGSGPELAYLKEHSAVLHLNEHVSFTGFIDDDLLGTLLRRSYVFFQPGAKRDDDSESLGMVFMEAAWFALPVVAGKLGGVEEVVLDQVTGLLNDPSDPNHPNEIQSIAGHLHSLLSSRQLHSKYSQNAEKLAKKYFNNRRLYASVQKRLSLSLNSESVT